jgi:hypothetical protein
MFEDYHWTLRAVFGFALVLFGTHSAEPRPYPGDSLLGRFCVGSREAGTNVRRKRR